METKTVRTISVENPPSRQSPSTVQVPRNKSDSERLAEVVSKSRVDRFIEQEKNRAPRRQADTGWTLNLVLGLVGIAIICSGIVSFNGITDVAATVGLTFVWQTYLFFGFVEVAIFIFTMLYLIQSSRLDDSTGEPDEATGAFSGLVAFSGLAILSNAYHTLQFHDWDLSSPDTYMGTVLSIAAPVAIIWFTKILSTVVFAKAIFIDVPKRGRPIKNG